MVDVQRDGGVARIFLNRPQKVNALDTALLDELAAALERLASDAALRVLVLGGRGRAFCGGADIDELAALEPASARAFVGSINRACAALRAAPGSSGGAPARRGDRRRPRARRRLRPARCRARHALC